MVENKRKPGWSKPKLVILTRGRPEERVLTSCKVNYTASGPGSGGDDHCQNLGPCEWCSGSNPAS